jgi:hypothetical protein
MHPTQTLSYTNQFNNTYDVDIDNELVELMQLMWKYNIYTNGCCQCDPQFNQACIGFSNGSSYEKFLSVVCSYDDNFDNIEDYHKFLNMKTIIGAGDLNCPLVDFPEDFEDKLHNYKKPYCKIQLHVLLRFPVPYIQEFVKKFKELEQIKETNDIKEEYKTEWLASDAAAAPKFNKI